MNTTIKKQNRILLAVLVVILAAAAILIAVTGSANKKEKNSVPPAETGRTVEDKAETSLPAESDAGKTAAKESVEELTPEKPSADESQKTGDEADKDAADLDDEDEAVASIQSEALPKFSVPVDNFVVKDYSMEVPVFSYTMNDYRTHNGIDIACSAGTPVLAAADGFVCEVANDPMMGVTIGIQHAGGAVTRYRGLAEESMTLVKNGDEVKRGQVIGASGETALIESAEEPHVHFELTVNGESKDPGDYMKLTRLADVHEG